MINRARTHLNRMIALNFATMCLMAASVAIAQDGVESAGAPCPALSIDSRFETLRATAESYRDLHVGITHLLSESFTPYLQSIHDFVVKIPQEKIVEKAREIRIRESRVIMGRRFGVQFQKVYSGAVISRILHVSGTSFNSATMIKLLRAICVMQTLVVEANFHTIELQGSKTLLPEKTFAGPSLFGHLNLGFESVLQSAAQLTSDPILDMTPEDVLRAITTQRDSKPSLMVLHSLMLPPALLGQNGHISYIPNSLAADGKGGITFSPAYRTFIKEQRASFLAKTSLEKYEFGHGCPVGHCLSGEERPGLQYFIDAIFYIYDQIGDSQ